MKNIFFAVLLIIISCKQNSLEKIRTKKNPNIFFNGKYLVDKNRRDSMIYDLKRKKLMPQNYIHNAIYDLKKSIEDAPNLQIKEIQEYPDKIGSSTCHCDIDRILEKKRAIIYTISYKNTKAITDITEYSFANQQQLMEAYNLFYNYAEFLRNLSRDKYEFRCCDLWENQIYFVAVKGNKLYFIRDDYNFFSFNNENNTIQKQISKDKNIMMDDIYRIIK
ncbi:hypothetical protein [uncultured Chryseobacterium sp.]|uniref:hypothetical protein n=1 Tax=uncultured Chryseobacterium sp. TaxID=259322 RepID=UPI0025FDD443|nr:hypothetical protein [uncultured Chryseobacterium sp.]